MAEWVLKYADTRGEIHQQVAEAATENEIRERFSQQGFLLYSVRPRRAVAGLSSEIRFFGRRKKLNLEKFLIFNQQFVTLVRAGLPILKSLELLADRLTDVKLGPHIRAVRDEVRNGVMLSEAFRMQGLFPKIYVTSVMAGEKSGSLTDVLDRYIGYQKLSLAVRKKVLSAAGILDGPQASGRYLRLCAGRGQDERRDSEENPPERHRIPPGFDP